MNRKNGGILSIAVNRKARHYYEFLENIEAGIVLTGSEVKSLRAGKVSFADAYVYFKGGEAWLSSLHIAPYENAGYAQHKPERERKLLLHAWEISNLAGKVEQKGLTIVPVRMYFRGGRVKVELALARGKKMQDQRETLKQRAEERDTARELARYK
ncbi:MAG: SsrA-binding protein SmpB [Desulfovibrionaceae bacterium]|nr:SsrA-binding protein SmpB [Desulfovibrionaceae bacterium]